MSAAEADCTPVAPDDLAALVPEADLIVLGTAVSAAGTGTVDIDAEAYLKGPASSAPVRLEPPALDCPAADLEGGQRVLVFLEVRSGLVQWPAAGRTFQLEEGRALRYDGEQLNLTEGEFVQDIRDLTGQYAVPADTDSEGEGIEWGGTVAPVAGVLLVVFAIGLVLMRIWHRIDPS